MFLSPKKNIKKVKTISGVHNRSIVYQIISIVAQQYKIGKHCHLCTTGIKTKKKRIKINSIPFRFRMTQERGEKCKS